MHSLFIAQMWTSGETAEELSRSLSVSYLSHFSKSALLQFYFSETVPAATANDAADATYLYFIYHCYH